MGNNLYGINVTSETIKKTGKVILFESEKSCLQNYTYFGEDSFALAVCGSNITSIQQKLLINILQVKEVIVAFDKEYDDPHSFEAEAYYNKLVKKVAPLVPYCKVYLVLDTTGLLQKKDSPCDRGKEILLQLLKEKIYIDTDEVKRVGNTTKGVEKWQK